MGSSCMPPLPPNIHARKVPWHEFLLTSSLPPPFWHSSATVQCKGPEQVFVKMVQEILR